MDTRLQDGPHSTLPPVDPACVTHEVLVSWSPIRRQHQVMVWTGPDAYGGETWRVEWRDEGEEEDSMDTRDTAVDLLQEVTAQPDRALTVWTQGYIYTGLVERVTSHQVVFKRAWIVYETGKLDAPRWKSLSDEPLPPGFTVERRAVESWGWFDKQP